MMGHREKMKSGEEYDMLCRRSRNLLHHRAGRAKDAKRTFSRRMRKITNRQERSVALLEDAREAA
jgi:hypothetical protein